MESTQARRNLELEGSTVLRARTQGRITTRPLEHQTINRSLSKFKQKREDDFSSWFNELVRATGLAEDSPVRGCMTIKPYGFSLWEKLQGILDGMFKKSGHQNVYFPIFIPKSFLSREAKHVEGFAKECAVVTHYRLHIDPESGEIEPDPEARLEEELIVRPTSETLIWNAFRNWIQSYRDLPILINQWVNIVRWEMRTRPFLRTSEFLWQEGHTAHATKQEAEQEALQILETYYDFATRFLALPALKGEKTESERFAGAVNTHCIEALMQDGKALQLGTSHFLGQNFSKVFDVKFADTQGNQQYAWGSSWGVSTRLIGAIIMCHADDKGLILPPKVAPIQVVVIPVLRGEEHKKELTEGCEAIREQLEKAQIRTTADIRDDIKPGWKYAHYELKGVPLRISLGVRELESGRVEIVTRDGAYGESCDIDNLDQKVPSMLETLQDRMLEKAYKMQSELTTQVHDFKTFERIISQKGGFVEAHWDGTPETEKIIKERTKASIRFIPSAPSAETGKCILSGKFSNRRVTFAKAY